MQTVTPNLSQNLNQLFHKAVHLNDLQYDYYSKYLAAALISQTGPEVVVLSKEGGQLLTPMSTIATQLEPVFLSWVPPTFGNMLVVVLSDNSVCYFRNDYNCSGDWKVVYRGEQLCNAVSALSVGVSTEGELLVALGSLAGSVTVVMSTSRFETASLDAHNGGVTALAFNTLDGSTSLAVPEVLLATGGLDGCVRLWEFFGKEFKLVKSLPLGTDPSVLQKVQSLCWSKEGHLAAATETTLYVFEKAADWALVQTVKLREHNLLSLVAFNNDRIVLLQDNETLVLKRNEAGSFEQFGKLAD